MPELLPPTQEFYVPDGFDENYSTTVLEPTPNVELLPFKPFDPDTLTVLWDLQSTSVECAEVLINEFKSNEDYRELVEAQGLKPKTVKHKKAIDNPGICNKLIEIGVDYANMQEDLGDILSEDLLNSIPKEVSKNDVFKGTAVDKYKATKAVYEVYIDKVADEKLLFADHPGFETWFKPQRAAKKSAGKPIDERLEIIADALAIFTLEQAKAAKKAAVVAAKQAVIDQVHQKKAEAEQQKAELKIAKAETRALRIATKTPRIRPKAKTNPNTATKPEVSPGQLEMDFNPPKAKAPAEAKTSSGQPDIIVKGINITRILREDEKKVGVTIKIVVPNLGAIAHGGFQKVKNVSSATSNMLEGLGTDKTNRVKAIAATAIMTGAAAGLLASSNTLLQKDTSEDDKMGGNPDFNIKLKVGKLVKPSEEAMSRLDIAPDRALRSKRDRKLIIEQGKDYAKTRVGNISAKASQVEDSLADNDEARKTVQIMDRLALYGLNLAINNPKITAEEIDQLSELASDAMIAVRHPKIAQKAAPAGNFQKEIAGYLQKASFENVPSEQYTEEQQKVLSVLLSKLFDAVAPKAHQGDVMNALIAKSASIDGLLKKGPSKSNTTSSRELSRLNPEMSLATFLAATSIMESGRPADPKAKNQFGCYGYLQYCPPYWEGRAEKYLGNRNAKLTVDNQTMVAVLEWTEVMNSLDSGGAAMAAWLKGRAVGNAVAGLNKKAYDQALVQRDGNGTSVRQYMATIEKYAKTVDVKKQLPFLDEVMKRNPDFNWSLLSKKYDLYSHYRLRQVKPHTNQVLQDRAKRQKTATFTPRGKQEKSNNRERIDGAVDLGMRRVYVRGKSSSTRLYAIKGFKSVGQESTPGSRYYIRGANHNVVVGKRAAKNVVSFFRAAKADGITLRAYSSLRVNRHQGDLARSNPNRNEVAAPGHSGHEDAINKSAIDLYLGRGFPIRANFYTTRNGKATSITNPRVAPKSKTWRWMNRNARRYGYVQYFYEPWHYQMRIKIK